MVRRFKEGESCVECGTTERLHHAKGLCVNCYARLARKRNPEAYRKINKRHEQTEKRKKWVKELHSKPEYKQYINKKAAECRARHKEVYYERTREWRLQNREHLDRYNESRKITKVLRQYGEDAYRLMIECEGKCQKCGSIKRVAIHHVDWNKSHGDYDNLAVLCGSCHSKLHNWVPPRFRREIFEEFMATPNDELR